MSVYIITYKFCFVKGFLTKCVDKNKKIEYNYDIVMRKENQIMKKVKVALMIVGGVTVALAGIAGLLYAYSEKMNRLYLPCEDDFDLFTM